MHSARCRERFAKIFQKENEQKPVAPAPVESPETKVEDGAELEKKSNGASEQKRDEGSGRASGAQPAPGGEGFDVEMGANKESDVKPLATSPGPYSCSLSACTAH